MSLNYFRKTLKTLKPFWVRLSIYQMENMTAHAGNFSKWRSDNICNSNLPSPKYDKIFNVNILLITFYYYYNYHWFSKKVMYIS